MNPAAFRSVVALTVLLACAASPSAANEQSAAPTAAAVSRGFSARRLLQDQVVQCPQCRISCSNVQCNQCDCGCYEVQCNQPGAQNVIRVTNAPPPAAAATPATPTATPAAEGAPTTVTAIIDGMPTEVTLIDQPAANGTVRGIAVINGTEIEVLLRPAADEEAAGGAATTPSSPAPAGSPTPAAPTETATEPAAEPAALAPEAATTTVTIDGQQQQIILVEGPTPSSATATGKATINVDGQPQEVTLAPVEDAAAAATANKVFVLVSAPEKVKQAVEVVPMENVKKEVVVVTKPEKPAEPEKPKEEKKEYVYVEAKPMEKEEEHPSKVVHINIFVDGKHDDGHHDQVIKKVVTEKKDDEETTDDSSSDNKVETETVQVVTVQKCPDHCKWYLKVAEEDRPEDCFGCIKTAEAKALAKEVAENEGLDYVFA